MKAGQAPKLVVAHGWTLFAHPLFLDQVDALIAQVEGLRQKNSAGYRQKNPTKRLAAILELISKTIPQDPARPEHRQGDALGKEHR
ncbi:MAG: type II toxin-antitoxin system YhaV family toxin, partial [bacterium]